MGIEPTSNSPEKSAFPDSGGAESGAVRIVCRADGRHPAAHNWFTVHIVDNRTTHDTPHESRTLPA